MTAFSPLSSYAVVSNLFRLTLSYYIRSLEGFENLPKAGPYILAANHSSHLDQFLLLSQLIPRLGRRIHAVADQKTWFETSYLRRAIARYFDAIPIERGGDTAEGIRKVEERLDAGGIVLLYPEGTRSPNGKLQRGKTGLARVALAAGVPVVPVGILGAFDLLPRDRSFPRLDARGTVTLRIGKPLDLAALGGRDEDASPGVYRKVTDRVMLSIAELIGQEYPFAQDRRGPASRSSRPPPLTEHAES